MTLSLSLDADSLRRQMDVTSVVPDVYAEFRPPVADALVFFLLHLSPARLAAIYAEQAALPPSADTAARIVRFMHACPALHKLGQVIARNRQLDPALRRRLQQLESMEPRTPMDELRPILDRELAPFQDTYRVRVANRPLAEASVAVVLPCTWIDPANRPAGRQHAVVKILKPGIADKLHEDLHILSLLADHLDSQPAGRLPPAAYRDAFDEVRQLLTHEVLFEHEQNNLRIAAGQYAHEPAVHIPALLPFCTAQLTAMQRIRGVKATEIAARPPAERRRLADRIVRALLADILFSQDPSVLFHADPHAGNLFAADDGGLAILDWSLTARLDLHQRIQLSQILIGALSLNAARMRRAVDGLATSSPPAQAVARYVDQALAQIRRGQFPGPSWLMRFVDSLGQTGVSFPGNLLLFRKSYFTLEGVIADVCPDRSLAAILTAQAAGRFAAEWPARAFATPTSRSFPTHLSNLDLWQVNALLPFTLLAMWAEAAFSPRTGR